jgi:hypothetical protein
MADLARPRRAALAAARRDERLKRMLLAHLVGTTHTTAEMAGHVHRSLQWTRSALLGLRVTEIEEGVWQLDDELEPEE